MLKTHYFFSFLLKQTNTRKLVEQGFILLVMNIIEDEMERLSMAENQNCLFISLDNITI